MRNITVIQHLLHSRKVLLTFLFVGILIASNAVSTLSAFAISSSTYDEQFYSSNDILFSSPVSGSTNCSVVGGSVSTLTGSNNREKIFNFWLAQGLSQAQAAGITGSMQHEGGFSPFRQEEGVKWPAGGYGIAQFTGGQRTAATKALKSDLADTYTTYYDNKYGGATDESKGFVPDGIPVDVNDKFLLSELTYLATYTSSFTPSTIPVRVDGVKADYGQIVPDGTKLLAYLKTLSSASDAAIAWTYLYESPDLTKIKATAADRATSAEAIQKMYSDTTSTKGSCSVGSGGLTYDQAKVFMADYWNNKKSYFEGLNNAFGKFWGEDDTDQCTTFVAYFTSRFIMAGPSVRDGVEVVDDFTSLYPKVFTSADKDHIQPYTIFTGVNSGHGHTGVILGIDSDGSIVIGEGNAKLSGKGLIDITSVGVKNDGDKGSYSVEHWQSVDDWVAAMKTQFSDVIFANNVDESSVTSKVQDYYQTIGGK